MLISTVRRNCLSPRLLRAIGFESDKDILEIFNLAEEVKVTKTNLKKVIGRKLAARVLKTWIEDFVMKIPVKSFPSNVMRSSSTVKLFWMRHIHRANHRIGDAVHPCPQGRR
jgi:DNA-directed RNA polymerase beta subunit